jgi:hypothetical protein
MHKPVRYHITESDDRPVVRSVPVAITRQPSDEAARRETETGNAAPDDRAESKPGRKLRRMPRVRRKHDS